VGLWGFATDEISTSGMRVGIGIVGISVVMIGCSGIGVGCGCLAELSNSLLGIRFLGMM